MAEAVTSFDRYQPSGKKYEVSLSFSGDAAVDIKDLMAWLGVDSPNDVALRAIALLHLAQSKGKELALRDPTSGSYEDVDI
jgi:hypothetical protein